MRVWAHLRFIRQYTHPLLKVLDSTWLSGKRESCGSVCPLIVASAIPSQGILDVPEDDVAQHVKLLTHLTHAQNTVPIAAIHPLSTGSKNFLKRTCPTHKIPHELGNMPRTPPYTQTVNRKMLRTFCH